ncbi:MAG TPA: GIY-YIG nuclease family protein [Burkholderiaceae bacterium]
MIENYGLIWPRKYIHVGAGSNKGTLLGYNAKVGIVDFREQIGIYVLYDRNMLPVYVGQSGSGSANLFNRLKSHTKGRIWHRWEYFSWFGLRKVNKTGRLHAYGKSENLFKTTGAQVLNQLEGVLIAATEPRFNRQGARFGGAIEFYPVDDENVTEMTLESISFQISEIQTQLSNLNKK